MSPCRFLLVGVLYPGGLSFKPVQFQGGRSFAIDDASMTRARSPGCPTSVSPTAGYIVRGFPILKTLRKRWPHEPCPDLETDRSWRVNARVAALQNDFNHAMRNAAAGSTPSRSRRAAGATPWSMPTPGRPESADPDAAPRALREIAARLHSTAPDDLSSAPRRSTRRTAATRAWANGSRHQLCLDHGHIVHDYAVLLRRGICGLRTDLQAAARMRTPQKHNPTSSHSAPRSRRSTPLSHATPTPPAPWRGPCRAQKNGVAGRPRSPAHRGRAARNLPPGAAAALLATSSFT